MKIISYENELIFEEELENQQILRISYEILPELDELGINIIDHLSDDLLEKIIAPPYFKIQGYNILLLVYNKGQLEEYEEYLYDDTPSVSTGVNPFATAKKVRALFKESFEFLKQNTFANINIIQAGFKDKRREKVYGHFLKNFGFKLIDTEFGDQIYQTIYIKDN